MAVFSIFIVIVRQWNLPCLHDVRTYFVFGNITGLQINGEDNGTSVQFNKCIMTKCPSFNLFVCRIYLISWASYHLLSNRNNHQEDTYYWYILWGIWGRPKRFLCEIKLRVKARASGILCEKWFWWSACI